MLNLLFCRQVVKYTLFYIRIANGGGICDLVANEDEKG